MRRLDRMDLVLPWTALLPALVLARWWPGSSLADLPALTLVLYAAWRLAGARGRAPGSAFVMATVGTAGVWVAAALIAPLDAGLVLVSAAAGLLLAGWLAALTPAARARVARHAALPLGLMVATALVLRCPLPEPATAPATASRPGFFLPLELDPEGRRLLLFSLRDIDEEDDTSFSLWSLDVRDGGLARTFRGYPLFLTDWCPAGNSVTFMDSDRSWEEEDVPFGVRAATFDGRQCRRVLEPPGAAETWSLPMWSKRGDWIGAWLMTTGGLSDVPRSFVVPASGGPKKLLAVPGCRLALLGAWQADQPGGFVITERGIFRVAVDGGARRLVPAGEAPLDPFPFVVPAGVAPSGRHLAYLELVFRRGEIDRIDLGVTDMSGRRRRVLSDIYPVAFGWSRDGGRLAAAQVDRRQRIRVSVFDVAEGRRRVVDTGLRLASRELPMRLTFSRDGRYLALDGQIRSDETWDIATIELETGKTKVLDSVGNHLAIGWRQDDRLVVADLTTVLTVRPDGTDPEPVYGHGGGATVRQLGAWATELSNHTLRGLSQTRAALARLNQDR